MQIVSTKRLSIAHLYGGRPLVFLLDCSHEDVDDVRYARGLLCAGELSRLSMLLHPHERRLRTIARAALRVILAPILRVDPSEVRLRPGRYGKPRLEPPFSPQLAFNVSHAGTKVAIAVDLAPAVGIDIEWVNTERDLHLLASKWFHASEREKLSTAPTNMAATMFYRYWTLKEAYVKALGLGLTTPLAALPFELEGDAPRLISRRAETAARRWHFTSDSVDENHILSVAVRCCRRDPTPHIQNVHLLKALREQWM